MDARIRIAVQEADFDLTAEIDAMCEGRADIGAVVSFSGLVRDITKAADGRPVTAMELEHYPGMTERSLRAIAEEACARWPLQAATVVHRVGPLLPGDRIVLAAAASPHRKAAFEAAEFLMDYLKTKAPFWKKETTPEGEAWVDAREEDDEAAARWKR